MNSQPEVAPIDASEAVVASCSARKLNAASIELDPGARSRLVFLTDPHGLAVERYKLLRRQLYASNMQGGLMLISSPSPADGKTLTSINLAFCLAAGGHSTCLVDFDYRSPGICPTLQFEPDTGGLFDVLEGRATLSQAVRQISKHDLYVLGMTRQAGTRNPPFDSTVLRPFLNNLRATFAWVIFDMAPAIPFSDVPEFLPEVDGALLVVRAGQTKKSLVAASLEIMANKLSGVVLNDAVVSGGDYYGYYERSGKGKRNKKQRADEERTLRFRDSDAQDRADQWNKDDLK
jgi:Mrp family chromosome partitioning ATPase